MRFPAALVLVALLSSNVFADENKEITFHAGLMSLSPGKVPGGSAGGSAYGFRFLRDEGDILSLGMDVDLLKPKEKSISNPVPNSKATRSMSSSSVLGVARIGNVEGDLRPYFLIGFGIHFTNVRLEASPSAGSVWSDTGTSERRTLMDADGRAMAIKIQAGADYAVTDNFLAGGFLAYNNMGGASYDPTDEGRSLGLGTSSGSMTAITFGVNLTGRF